MKRRVVSLVMILVLCLNLCPTWAFAAGDAPDGSLCPHHPAHTDECGYALPVEGQECTHVHDESCYTVQTDCVHVHTAECYPASDGDAGEPVLCTHECTEESGCITRTLACTHEHDDTCGYVAEAPGGECTFVCRICPLEELIGALPEKVSQANSEEVGEQLGEIFDRYDELTEEEQAQVDLSSCAALMDQLEELGAGMLVASNGSDVFDEDMNLTAPYVVDEADGQLTLNTNGHTLTNTAAAGGNTTAIQVTGTGKLYLQGKVVSQKGIGVEVEAGGLLRVTGADTVINGYTYGISIAKGADVKLSAGTYSSKSYAIHLTGDGVTGEDYAKLLEEGFAFFADGEVLSPSALATAKYKNITVGQCSGHSKIYTPTAGAPTHTWTCEYCGASGTEKCDFTFDGNGVGTCGICGNELTVTVDRESLKALAYDNSVQPANGTVTVTVGDPGTTLTADTDYTVSYKTQADVGNTDITVTVTVEGKTYNGTFTHDYTFTETELEQPVLKWETPGPVSVPYTGSPVTKDQLPGVTINITTSSGVDLHDLLRYSYRVHGGNAAYTDGLPTDAGTYDVVVSLSDGPDYQAASSEPITLKVTPIDPIDTAPTATKPTYNRGALLPLVTAGKLNPVAVAEGLEIQFATSEDGPWSTDIPTAANAGDYNVWYQVVGLTDNYTTPAPNPAQVTGVEILRKAITPKVKLSNYTYIFDGEFKQPAVTVLDDDNVTVLLDTEYEVAYQDNQNVGTAKVIVTDSDLDGGNYTLEKVEVPFEITLRPQEALSITQKPNTVTYGEHFTLGTSGGSGNGLVTWEITSGTDVASVDENSGQVTIIGDGLATVKATKSGTDPNDTNVKNYEDATASWTFMADKKPVTATVTAEDKTYDGNTTATIHAVVESGVLPGDEITITGLTGTFDDKNAGVDKTVTVNFDNAAINGHNSEHYAVSYSATTVKATINKATATITTPPVAGNLTYDGTAQELIGTAAVVDPNTVPVEYALDEAGPYSTNSPEGTDAGTYTVWYRVQETQNYTGTDPASVPVTIDKKPVAPTITLDEDTFVYDGNPKEPGVTLHEADGTTLIPAGEYTVEYSGNVNVGTATVTVKAKEDGNYSFTDVTKNFTISKDQARVVTAPEAAGDPLTFSNRDQKLVTAGTAFGGTMVYRVGDTGDFKPAIPTETDAGEYKVYYKVQGDANHSDTEEAFVEVTIAPKRVDNPTIELRKNETDTDLLDFYTYDGTAKEPKVVVKDGSDTIDEGEYTVGYSDNTNAGRATVNITDNLNGNYTVTGSATFTINKANIVFNPEPEAATLTYNGTAQELLNPGTTSGGTVLYALGSATAAYHDYIPTATEAGTYNVYYKVDGDNNHNDLSVQGPVEVTIGRKPLTAPKIELTPGSFTYDGKTHLPSVTVKDGETVLPGSEYTWECNVDEPKDGGTYTITISDKAGGNYDLSGVTGTNAEATFTIGKAAQAELVIESKPAATNYGDTFTLTTSGGDSTGAVSWSVTGVATVDENNGTVAITNVGEVTVTATKAGDANYELTSAQWTFTAAPKPVTATVTVSDKFYDGTITATVASASITTINSDAVTIDPASIIATFDDIHVGSGKTVTLLTHNVRVTGNDAAKYDISYPATGTANITQATTSITTDPAAIPSLTYSGQPQALVTEGKTNVGFLVYSLDGTNFSTEVPTGTDAKTYTVYYKVDGTADYTAVAVNATPVSVTIGPKNITPTVELSETSFLYDGTTKNPVVTVKDGNIVIDPDQYTVTWKNDDPLVTDGLLTAAGTYTATITNVPNGNYSFTAEAHVEIKEATQAALDITGTPEHVYYGDTITTLKATGGTGNGTLKWSVTAGNATIVETTGVLTITGTGSVTVKAERTVPNYATATGTWTFTVEPKPVVAEVTVAPKDYDGTTSVADADITAQVKASDLVGSDTVTLSGLKGTYADPNVGTGKTVTLNDTNATKADSNGKYAISYPATAKGDITAKTVTVTVTLSDHDLKSDASGDYYEFNGTERTPTVTVTADDGAELTANDYSVDYADNQNVGEATVTVTAKAGGNYSFRDATVNFEIRKAGAALTSTPQAKDLTYTGAAQDLVTVGVATGGTVVYSKTGADGIYSETIPQETDAGTYTVYYKVDGDDNHKDTDPGQVSVTIKSREITPTITLSDTTYTYDGNPKIPAVTVKDGNTVIDGPGAAKPEYTVSYRNNVNAGTATVTVSDANGGNYIVNGSATFEITKAAPTVTAPTAKTGLYYTGETQDLVNAGVCHEGTVVYSVNGGNYSANVPSASAVGRYTIAWKVQGDNNHSDTTPVTLDVVIAKNTVNNPTISLSSNQFTYDGDQHRPTVTVYDKDNRVIPTHEYTVTITGTKGNTMVDVDTYTVTIAAAANSNYEFKGTLTRTFEIVPADQESISITGTQAQVHYGDKIPLGVSGGIGTGTVTWSVTGSNEISNTGLLTVKDVGGPFKVTVTRTRPNYGDVSATWEFSAAKKQVTAEVTVAAKNWDGDTTVASTAITAAVNAADLAFSGDTITITGLTGTYDNANVGTGKTVTLTGGTVGGDDADKYDVTIPATATGSILGVAATVDTAPEAVNPLTYDAAQSRELVTAGTASGGTMVYSLDGTNFTPNIPKGKDAGTYKVYFKAQGDQNHTDSAVGTVDVTINQQQVTPQIELTPSSARYDGNEKRPAVTVRDGANNVIPVGEYRVTYVTDGGANWTDQGTYTVKVENITGGNYNITTATADFTISATAQTPLTIVNKPGLVHYGDTFTLSTTGGSGNGAVAWSVDDAGKSVVQIDENGFVTIKGTGPATITATKAGGDNYGDATATYPLNALKKSVTATVTADDKVYDGNTTATIHITWDGLVGNDAINTSSLSGAFDNENVGTNKTVTVTANVVDNTTSQKYDITIPGTTTASITKATATAPSVTAISGLEYTGSAQNLVSGGDTNTRYSDARDGVYSENVPQKTNAGSYTVWYKAAGDNNHNESEPKSVRVTISPKELTVNSTNVTLSPASFTYDGTAKRPDVVIKDGDKIIPTGEYTVSYSDNVEVTTDAKKATVTITDADGGNYNVHGSVTFEISKGAAQMTRTPQANTLTYTGAAQELVTAGAATGGHLEYKLSTDPDTSYNTTIPKATAAGSYTVDCKVVGDGNYGDDPTIYSVPVTIQPKRVDSPKITVTGTYTYDGTEQKPTGTNVKVEDGTATIPNTEYTLSYRDNVNAGTATVIVTDNNGGNYTVNGTATFEIGKKAATGTAPTGKTGLKYNGTAQELITAGSSNDGTVVYSLTQNGEYSAAIPTGKDVGEYEIWYMVQGDGNHSDSTPAKLADKVKIEKNTVTNPTVQVEPASVKYTGEKQTPTVTVLDDAGLLIDGSEYTVTYLDENSNSDLIQVGTYTVTVTGKDTNYSFSKTAAFTITPADQTPLTITGTRERVYYGDTIQLGATGGIDGGTVTWTVSDGTIAAIDATGLLTIKGVGSVTVTATSTASGYNEQTATWALYANKKQVTAVVTADDKPYDGKTDAVLNVTWKAGDLADGDSISVLGLSGAFTDPNVGTGKTVKITGTLTHDNYDITVPPTTTASIFKAAATDVTAPEVEDDATKLEYTGLPLTLVKTAGSATGGTMEYSTDGVNYSASLPTGTDAKAYDVWYRVKGDGNHNDVAGTKLDTQVTITPQTVNNPTIELTPGGASYDGQEHKPTVKVLDGNGREILSTEYTVDYGSTNWRDVGDHTVTIVDKNGGNYIITGTLTKNFTILPAGQNPLSIVSQPGEVRYGDTFDLRTTGGSGTGDVTWGISGEDGVAEVNSATGRVKIKKAGGPVTITARKAAGGGYAETTATWTFSAEKRPVTPVITAKDKVFDSNDTAELVITWKDGDLLNGDDTINLSTVLSGQFDNANVGENKTVTINRTGAIPDGGGKYDVKVPLTTTASITAAKATVSGVETSPLTYDGSEQPLLRGGTATNGRLVYSENGTDFVDNSPTGQNAGRYQVWYKALGYTNYADSEVHSVYVTIQPKPVDNPTIELSPNSFDYDGTAKKPDVTVKDSSKIIPASEYTVGYSNNVNVGTTAKVTITDNDGGNYNVSGSRTFTITAGTASLKEAPKANNLTYNGFEQELVTAGTAVNGQVVYGETRGGSYSTSIPMKADAGTYQVWYKVQNTEGTDATTPTQMFVTIQPKQITPTIRLAGRSSYSATYTGSVIEPEVTVRVDGKEYDGPYEFKYFDNIDVGTAEVNVWSTGGNYQFDVSKTFEIKKAKAEFADGGKPQAKTLAYNGTAQQLVSPGTAKNGGTVLYSLDGGAYLPTIPTATNRGSYTVSAKVQGNANYEDSDVVIVPVEIGVNTLTAGQLTVTLSATNFPYTGSEVKPTVTVTQNGVGVISATEYDVTYSDNVAVGTAKVKVQSKTNGNYSFTAEAPFSIVDASQAPLTITGKKDAVYYGDTLSLGATGGGSGTVTWSESGPVDRLGDGQYKVKSSGSVTITVTKGTATDTWSFYANPKPITAVVTAANKVYDGDTDATLTVTISSGLVSGDTIATNIDGGVKAVGQFADAGVGTNKTVTITNLTIPADVSAKYDISHNSTTTASITPAPAAATKAPELVTGPLTYNGGAQALLTDGGTAANGNLAYSTDGVSYTFNLPTGTDAGSYNVWYKVVANDENHKDSAAVNLGTVTISANTDKPTVLCQPTTMQYDGTEKTPTVVVRDSDQRIIPESEYTVTFPANRITTGTHTVTVTDKPGGNYDFSGDVTGTFEIVSAAQNPLSIITSVPTDVHYGDTFRLSAMGGSGSGAINWSIAETNVATINANGVVTVKGTGGFTVKAYRAASDGYSKSNEDSVPFVANPKPVTPTVTASDKSYDGTTTANLTASWKSGDLETGDTITVTATGAFDTADAGNNKRVSVVGSATGADDTLAKYTITWPESTTASIYKVDAKLDTAPAAADLTYNKTAQALVTAGTTVGGIGEVVYAAGQNGTYSATIPQGTNAGKYTVWYKVAESVNYTGIGPASIEVEIKKANPVISTNPTASGTAGTKLGDIQLNGGAHAVPGTFAWEKPETEADIGTAYNVIFTPDDTDNYNTVTIQVVAVSAANNAMMRAPSRRPTTTTVENSTATTVVSAEDGTKLVQEAVKNQSETIVIKPEISEDVTRTEVSIPASTVIKITDETDAALTVSAPIADVTIPNAALETLSNVGGAVKVATEQTKDGVVLTLTAGGESVSSVPGGVTLNIPAEDAGPGTVAVLVKEDGTREVIRKSVTKDGTVSIPLEGSATVEIVDRSMEFADVTSADWEADAVAFASARGLFTGTSESTFSPDLEMSRAMLATVLHRLEGCPAQDEADGFSDVDSDTWYAGGVAWATSQGIMSGDGNGQFNPDESVTREQFALMLWKYAGKPKASEEVLDFEDAGQASRDALEALYWAVEKGILAGYAEGQLAPGKTVTRAETAQMLKNFMENV